MRSPGCRAFGKGTDGVGTNGATANLMFVFDRGPFGCSR